MSGRVFVARHGESLLNAVGRVQGWSDAPLTARGRAEAEALGATLAAAGAAIAAAFCADLGRHRETAMLALAVVAPGAAAQPDERWREIAFGAYEGARGERLWAELAQAHGMTDAASRRSSDVGVLDVLEALPEIAAHSGAPVESVADVQARALAALEDAVASSSGDVLVVTSGLTLLALLAAVDIDTEEFEGGIGNGAVVMLTREQSSRRWVLDPSGAPGRTAPEVPHERRVEASAPVA